MPPKRRSTRRAQGGSMKALASAVNWIKKNKAISKVANALGDVGVPYASKIGSVASKLGAGKRRRTRRARGRGSASGTTLNYAVKY